MNWQEITEANEFDNTALKARYNELNVQLFDGALPDIPVTYAVLKSVGGVAKAKIKGNVLVPGSLSIQISSMHFRDKNSTDGLLVHEMIHLFFYMNGDFREKHGNKFLRKMRELQQKVDFKIPLTDDVAGLELAVTPTKKVGVIILYKQDRTSVAVVAEQYMRDNLEALRQRWEKGVNQYHWAKKVLFVVCTGRIEKIYPVQRKKLIMDLNYFIVKEPALLDEALQNAEVLATIDQSQSQ